MQDRTCANGERLYTLAQSVSLSDSMPCLLDMGSTMWFLQDSLHHTDIQAQAHLTSSKFLFWETMPGYMSSHAGFTCP